ncbi:unnamed protein product [Coregonus sp. 'balchen']|nr:unnamed protein product [Coregonus sp. 'balchen']
MALRWERQALGDGAAAAGPGAEGASLPASVCGTRHTLCVVSRHYLRTATGHPQQTVFLEDIPLCQLYAYHRLTRLVKTRTYLNWPQDPGLQQ